MAKSRSCAVSNIRFKTGRGRVVSFQGRSAGSRKHGGDCAPKAPSAAVRAHRREFGTAAKACRRGIAKGPGLIKRMAICVGRRLNGKN